MAWTQAARDAAAAARAASAKNGSIPIPDHPYHGKTNAELSFIQRDASAAAKNMQGMGDAQAEGKYLDQVNDASTVLGYRQRGGADLSRSPATGVAAQHGIATEHLNDQGHEWGSPAALADFKAKFGGPRDHAAEQRSFNSGRREINQLRSQGSNMAWSDAARAAAAASRQANAKQAAHAQGVNQVGQWKHYDAYGRSLQQGDRVQDTHYGNAMGTVTRTYFEGGDPDKQPLMDVKLDSGGGGTTVTRQPGSVTRYVSPEQHEYNRDLALRSRNGQVGSGMKFRG